MVLLLVVFAFGLFCGWLVWHKPQALTVSLNLPPQPDDDDEMYEALSVEAQALSAHAVERKWMH